MTDQEKAESPTSSIGSTLRSVAQDLHNGSSQEQVLGQVVNSLADASDALRDNDMDDAIQNADSFARSNPLIFLADATLAGFAATRLVKAATAQDTSQPHSDTHSENDTA